MNNIIVTKYAIGDIIILDETDCLLWIYNITKTKYQYLYKLNRHVQGPISIMGSITSMYTDIFRELEAPESSIFQEFKGK